MYFCSDKRKLLSYCKNRSVSQTLDQSRGASIVEKHCIFSVKMSPTSVFGNVNFCRISIFENVKFGNFGNFVEFQFLKPMIL